MELTLLMNYVELDQEEIMYLDGGWSMSVLVANLEGALKKGGAIATAVYSIARLIGKDVKLIKFMSATASWIVGKVGWLVTKVVSLVGGFWAGFIAGMATAGVVWATGTYRMFY